MKMVKKRNPVIKEESMMIRGRRPWPRLILITSVISLITACDVSQHKPAQKYRELLVKDVAKISKCEAVDYMYTDLATAPPEVTKNLAADVKEVWTLKGCKKGDRKRVEISIITDKASSYTITQY